MDKNIFEYVYKDSDGFESIWKYDLTKFKHGPISVEHKYPPNFFKDIKKQNDALCKQKKLNKQSAKKAKPKIKN